MLTLSLILIFLCGLLTVIGLKIDVIDQRPTLKMYDLSSLPKGSVKKAAGGFSPWKLVSWISVINRPFVSTETRSILMKKISLAHLGLTPEEFFLIKEIMIGVLLYGVSKFFEKDMLIMALLMALGGGWVLPDMWLRGEIKKVKDSVIRQLPDTVDLLGLCVNAGLDFMMALKWVIEKSSPSVLIMEMNNMLQEINVGKPRRDALRDLARKYELPDLATFSRTLIQADKMGTSVSEALNILSEDMRLARYRRGEAMALKAPLKMLVPLLFCIFPVVGILVAAPIFLDFMYNNPIKNMAGG